VIVFAPIEGHEQPGDRVWGERAAAAGREQRVLGLALTFAYPRLQDCDSLVVERRATLLASLTEAADVGAVPEMDVAAAQSGELGDPQPGLDRDE
jgi:hypothetical protein